MEYLFVYGTLKDPKVQKEIIGRLVEERPAVLSGFIKKEVKIVNESALRVSNIETHPIIVRSNDENDSVEGMVLSVSGEELLQIDTYEDEAYQRQKVRLQNGERAWVYEKSDSPKNN